MTPKQCSEAGDQVPLIFLTLPCSGDQTGSLGRECGTSLYGFLQSPLSRLSLMPMRLDALCTCFWKLLSHLHLIFFFFNLSGCGWREKNSTAILRTCRYLCSHPHLADSRLERPWRKEPVAAWTGWPGGPSSHHRTTLALSPPEIKNNWNYVCAGETQGVWRGGDSVG